MPEVSYRTYRRSGIFGRSQTELISQARRQEVGDLVNPQALADKENRSSPLSHPHMKMTKAWARLIYTPLYSCTKDRAYDDETQDAQVSARSAGCGESRGAVGKRRSSPGPIREKVGREVTSRNTFPKFHTPGREVDWRFRGRALWYDRADSRVEHGISGPLICCECGSCSRHATHC